MLDAEPFSRISSLSSFLAEFEGGTLTPRPGEIREILLLPYEQALTYFEHESSRRILSAAYAFLTA